LDKKEKAPVRGLWGCGGGGVGNSGG